MNWTLLLNEIFQTSGVALRPDQEIIVVDMNFMKKLPNILADTTPRTLANYIHWSLLRQWLPLISNGTDEDDDLSGAKW